MQTFEPFSKIISASEIYLSFLNLNNPSLKIILLFFDLSITFSLYY